MNVSARNQFRAKARRLLRLYSLWHETNSIEIQRKCLALLGEILAIDPGFSLQKEFKSAF
jgi:hypothetical protein